MKASFAIVYWVVGSGRWSTVYSLFISEVKTLA